MPKYYSLLYGNHDTKCGMGAYVTNLIKISDNGDIYAYLADIYLENKIDYNYDEGDAYAELDNEFRDFCRAVNQLVRNKYCKNEITHENVYNLIKYGCTEDNFDSLIITEHKLFTNEC